MRKPEQIELYRLNRDIFDSKAGEYVEVLVRRDYVEIELDEGVYFKILNRKIPEYFSDNDTDEYLIRRTLEDYRDGVINHEKCINMIIDIRK